MKDEEADLLRATEGLARTVLPDVRVPVRDAAWAERNMRELGDITPPASRARKVVVTGFSRFGFWANAKVYQGDYFPDFTRHLADHGVDGHFVWDEAGL